jgi:hypothetical protein
MNAAESDKQLVVLIDSTIIDGIHWIQRALPARDLYPGSDRSYAFHPFRYTGLTMPERFFLT